MKKLIILLFASLFLFGAKPSTNLTFTRNSVDHQQPVEQQSANFFYNNCGGNPNNPACDPSTWVYNPTNCDWDLDDHESWVATGDIPANTTVSANSCQVSDGLISYGHWESFQASVSTNIPNLLVKVTNDFGDSWTLTPVSIGKGQYNYVLCGYQNRPGPYPTIPDSNGGYGFIVTYTLSITTTKAAQNVYAVYQHGPGIYSIC